MDDAAPGSAVAEPPLSRLAVTALVLAVVPLCPPLNLVGVLLGLVAAHRIRRAAGRLSGRRLAMGAILAGWLSSIAWTGLGWWVGSAVQQKLEQSMVEAVTASIAEASTRPESVRAMHWMEVGAPSGDALASFARSAQQRFGRVERISITSMISGGTMARPTYTVAMTVYFDEHRQCLGSAHFRTVPGTMRVRLARIALSDPGGGDLVLGEAPP